MIKTPVVGIIVLEILERGLYRDYIGPLLKGYQALGGEFRLSLAWRLGGSGRISGCATGDILGPCCMLRDSVRDLRQVCKGNAVQR